MVLDASLLCDGAAGKEPWWCETSLILTDPDEFKKRSDDNSAHSRAVHQILTHSYIPAFPMMPFDAQEVEPLSMSS